MEKMDAENKLLEERWEDRTPEIRLTEKTLWREQNTASLDGIHGYRPGL